MVPESIILCNILLYFTPRVLFSHKAVKTSFPIFSVFSPLAPSLGSNLISQESIALIHHTSSPQTTSLLTLHNSLFSTLYHSNTPQNLPISISQPPYLLLPYLPSTFGETHSLLTKTGGFSWEHLRSYRSFLLSAINTCFELIYQMI